MLVTPDLGILQNVKSRILMGKNPLNFFEAKFHSKYLRLN